MVSVSKHIYALPTCVKAPPRPGYNRTTKAGRWWTPAVLHALSPPCRGPPRSAHSCAGLHHTLPPPAQPSSTGVIGATVRLRTHGRRHHWPLGLCLSCTPARPWRTFVHRFSRSLALTGPPLRNMICAVQPSGRCVSTKTSSSCGQCVYHDTVNGGEVAGSNTAPPSRRGEAVVPAGRGDVDAGYNLGVSPAALWHKQHSIRRKQQLPLTTCSVPRSSSNDGFCSVATLALLLLLLL